MAALKSIGKEFEFEITRLKEENSQLRYQKELTEQDFENVAFENNTLNSKLENLENVFIGASIQRNQVKNTTRISNSYTTSTLLLENTEMKKKAAKLEEEKVELSHAISFLRQKAPRFGSAAFG